jgi:undecaprenyl-diphosphatase
MDFIFQIFQAIVYGIVQGVAEFLPISSTAHLKLLPWFFGWKDLGMSFDVALHLGTAAAVILFFYKDWIRLFKEGFTTPKSKYGKLFWLIVVATIPGAIAGVTLSDFADKLSSNFLIIGIVLIFMGIVLYVADIYGKKAVKLEEIGLKRSIIIGVCQVFAIIPGVSRSGVTMSAGRALGIKRESIAKFTFLMSAPIILADGLYHMMKIIKGDTTILIGPIPFIVAIATAAIVGAVSIKFLLNYIKTKSFRIFTVYRFALGTLVIAVYFIKG